MLGENGEAVQAVSFRDDAVTTLGAALEPDWVFFRAGIVVWQIREIRTAIHCIPRFHLHFPKVWGQVMVGFGQHGKEDGSDPIDCSLGMNYAITKCNIAQRSFSLKFLVSCCKPQCNCRWEGKKRSS